MTEEVMLKKLLELAQECVLTSREYLNDKFALGEFNIEVVSGRTTSSAEFGNLLYISTPI